jgi:hypothetical protein
MMGSGTGTYIVTWREMSTRLWTESDIAIGVM